MMVLRIVAAALLAAAGGACMGRAPQPVAVIQPQDQFMDNGWKVAQNVAAGVGGVFIWPLWFAMDFQGTADKEATALQSRQQYLGALAVQKRCGQGPQHAQR